MSLCIDKRMEEKDEVEGVRKRGSRIMKETIKKHKILVRCLLISIALLVVFFYLQYYDSKVLSLEAKWLVVAAVPLLIALFAGGYIKKFKGFGIELESLLQNPIGRVSLIATDVLEGLPVHEKGTYRQLQRLSDEKRAQVKRLSFTILKRDYYGADAIRAYLDGLPNLEYFEVKKVDGSFLYLIPVEIFKDMPDMPNMYIGLDRFIMAIEENSIVEMFGESAIDESVVEDESLVGIVPKIRASKFGVLPVVSESGRLIGIVNTRLVERRITDEVVAAVKRI